MGLAYQPVVTVRGQHAELINSRLISWELIDAAGQQSDQLSLQIDSQGLAGLPKEGALLGFAVGYAQDAALSDKGEYKITRITARIYPHRLSLIATAAPFQVDDPTEFKKRRARSFENLTLGTLFRQIVQPHGYSPRVDPAIDSILIAHVDQSDETDMSFIRRLAKRHDALTKPINQLYILARRGQLMRFSGPLLEPVRLALPLHNQPNQHSFINVEADFASRALFKGVVATYWDQALALEVAVKLGEAPFKKLRSPFESLARAEEMAEGELRKLARQGVKIRLNVPGNPRLVAEGLIELDNSFPDFLQGAWSIDRVVSRGNRGQGYRCSIEATAPQTF